MMWGRARRHQYLPCLQLWRGRRPHYSDIVSVYGSVEVTPWTLWPPPERYGMAGRRSSSIGCRSLIARRVSVYVNSHDPVKVNKAQGLHEDSRSRTLLVLLGSLRSHRLRQNELVSHILILRRHMSWLHYNMTCDRLFLFKFTLCCLDWVFKK